MSGLPYSTVNSLLRGKSDSPNLKTLIRIATAFNMTIVEFLNVPEIIEFSEDDLEDESECSATRFLRNSDRIIEKK